MGLRVRRWGIVALAGCLVLSFVAAFSSLAGRAAAQFSPSSSSLQASAQQLVPLDGKTVAQLQAAVEQYMAADTAARHWVLRDMKLTLTSHGLEQDRAQAAFLAERWHTLDYARAGDVPAFKGRLRYLAEHKSQLCAVQVAVAQAQNDSWRQDLEDYTENTQYATTIMHAVGVLGPAGKVAPSSVTLYEENPDGRLVPASLDLIPTETQAQAEGYRAMEETCRDAAQGLVGTVAHYDRLAARNYVRAWTSTTTTQTCDGQPVSVYQDVGRYNTRAYTTYYPAQDCCNFVSQGCAAGGLPRDSTWRPYTDAWTCVPDIVTYMTATKGHWVQTTVGNCVAGCPFTRADNGHILMMSYNDGISSKLCAHTNDRQDYTFTGTDYTFYRVVY